MTKSVIGASWRRRLSIRLHRWHRRIGVLASLFLIWMAISGWLLNHTGVLQLASNNVHTDWILQRYGIATEMPERAFITASTPAHWLIASADATFLDGKSIAAIPAPLGIVASDALLFIGGATQLQIFTHAGAPVDTVPASLLPIANIERIGSGCEGVVIAAAEKMYSSRDGASWNACGEPVQWASSTPITAAQKAIIEPLLQPGISAERLLLDLHSGRFLGSWGPYFVDTLAAAMVVLASTGVWMFTQQRRRQKKRLH